MEKLGFTILLHGAEHTHFAAKYIYFASENLHILPTKILFEVRMDFRILLC